MNRAMLFAAAALITTPALAAITLDPKTSFSSDGWISPADLPARINSTDGLARGLAYNPATGNLLLASRTGGNAVAILNATSGAETGTMNLGSGVISGGGGATFNMIGASADGQVYLTNLITSGTGYKVYRWGSQTASTPVAVYNGNSPVTGARLGDSLDVVGTGDDVRLVAGYSNSPAVTGNNGYAVFSQIDDGAGNKSLTGTNIAFTGTPPNAGDFRLGVTFGATGEVIGTQAGTTVRYTSYDLATGTGSLISSPALSAITGNSRAMDYININGLELLAIVDTGATGVTTTVPGTVRIYDITNPNAPLFLASGRAQSGNSNANGNGTGAVQFGNVTAPDVFGVYSVDVYSLVTNNGVQAFTLTIPEPTSLAAVGIMGLLGARRRR